MGNVWSLIQQTEKCPTICNTAPDPSKIDSGNSANIAGIGTFVLFFVSVGMTLLVSLINILRQFWDGHQVKHGRTSRRLQRKQQQDTRRTNIITESVILNLSDQQLISGLAMAATTRYFYKCEMTAYHYDLVCYMLLCSVTTHLVSLLAVDKYFFPIGNSARATSSSLALLVLRCAGIALTIILTGLVLFNRNAKTFPVEPEKAGLDLLKPAQCFFVGANAEAALEGVDDAIKDWFAKNWSHGLVQYCLFVVSIGITVPIALIHSFERGCSDRLRHPKFLLWPRLIILLVAIGTTAWTFSLAWSLRAWGQKKMQSDDAQGQNEWTFSQVLAVSLLALSPINLLNAATEKYDSRQRVDKHMATRDVPKAGESGYSLVNYV